MKRSVVTAPVGACQLDQQSGQQSGHGLDQLGQGLAVSAAAGTAAVSRLMLTSFRSYATLSLTINHSASVVVLTGENGAGKTNILEAISYLAPGRGMRGAALSDVQSAHHPQSWAVAGRITVASGEELITYQAGSGLDADNGRRTVRLDGETHSSSNILGQNWSILWLTPQMDRLFLEAPSGRRKFWDRLVLALVPDHASQVSAYERAMRERNKLLSADGWQQSGAWLNAIEARLASHAVAVALARVEALQALAPILAAQSSDCFPEPEIDLEGSLEEALLAGAFASDLEAEFRTILADSRAADANSGRQQMGVHKSDLLVRYKAKDMSAALCSTGEQKALLISLILGQAALICARNHTAPILLLDEVAAHLDANRRAALVRHLVALGSQCWLTGTDAEIFTEIAGAIAAPMTHFQVQDGACTPYQPEHNTPSDG